MQEWSQYAEKLAFFINPQTFPVAVTFLDDESGIPPSAKRPLDKFQVPMAPCQGASMARRYGWTVGFGPRDVGCAIAAHTHGWKKVTHEAAAADSFVRLAYAKDEEAARTIVNEFRCLDPNPDRAVVYAPLARVKLEPDVVLIYVNPAQLMRLIHGITYHTGHPIGGSFSGRASSCTEGVVAAYLDNTFKVVVPGNGDRVWAACQDHEMVMALPAPKFPVVIEGLEKSHQRGIRYPIPTFMKYRPEVAFSMPLSDIFDPQPQ